ncbi:MAG TPA: FKBP-type peptidyl-prolyl cis-trans isomerase [Aeromicrobium sp.]|nr:FKBP-type peptidyl-prolyl cis-trans isomerase [Aeromicrobium sp.]
MRKLLTIPAVLMLSVATLSACSSSDADKPKDCPTYKSGSASDSVKVTGKFGEKDPKATFDKPLKVKADSLQRTILDEGEGKYTTDGAQVEAVISVFNGRTGEKSLSEEATLTAGDTQTFEAFRAGIECVRVGSRVVTTVSAKDVYGDQGYESLEIKATDSLVIVTDVVKTREPIKASKWTTGAPEVTFKKTGEPVLTLSGTAPKDVTVKVLKEGTGETVKAGDLVTVNYQGRTWQDNGKIFQQTWIKGGQPAQLNTSQVVEGFKAGLVGQKVGTTVMISIPAEFGYGKEASADNELGGKDLLFVVEIKSIDKAE